MPRQTLFLIDGSSQMYRAYHAFRGRGLSDQQGHTTHAVYVFVTMLRKLINDHHPQYLAASFDLAGPTFRDRISAEYKATRRAMADVLALVGDTSDNVAGVPGVGKKGATDLIVQYGNLDALLEKAGELRPKYRDALTAHRSDALQSRELVTIRTDVPVDVDFESLRYRGGSRERCYELFTRLDFRSLKNDFAPTADTTRKDYALVQSLEELDELVAELRA